MGCSRMIMIILPPANEVCGKVLFLHVCVIFVNKGFGFPACITGHRPSIKWGWLPSMHYRSHDQYPGGLASQHAPQVYIQGVCLQRESVCRGVCLQRVVCIWGVGVQGGFAYRGWADPPELEKLAVCILLECFLVANFFESLKIMIYNSSLDTQH